MLKAKKADRSRKRKRTPLEIEEEQSRTLYVRLPHTIKNVDEIKSLFFGDYKVKLPRQSTRYCHVIFSDLEEKIKNLKAVKGKLIDEKPIYVGPPKPMNLEKKKKPKQKKVVIPQPKDETKIKKYLFISNIPPGVKASEVKDAFPGAVSVALMKGLIKGKRQAKLKMSSSQICLHYTKKENWPVIKEHKVSVCLSKKNSENKIRKQKKTESLKIYDGGNEQKDQSEVKDSVSKNVSKVESDEDEDDDNKEEEEENEEEENEEEEKEEEEEESSSEEE